MMVFKRKQIVVLSLVLMIVVAGYLQYSYKKSSVSASGKDNSRLGEAVYVDSKDLSTNEKKNTDDSKDKKDNTNTNNKIISLYASVINLWAMFELIIRTCF